jgi:hypothetical protein
MNDNLGPVGVAVTTGGAVAAQWLVNLNEVLAAVSAVVAIIAGCATAWHYIDRTLAARRARKGK